MLFGLSAATFAVQVNRIFETLTEIAATGVSVLLVEQYVTRALAPADSACLLNRGAVVCSRDRPMSSSATRASGAPSG